MSIIWNETDRFGLVMVSPNAFVSMNNYQLIPFSLTPNYQLHIGTPIPVVTPPNTTFCYKFTTSQIQNYYFTPMYATDNSNSSYIIQNYINNYTPISAPTGYNGQSYEGQSSLSFPSTFIYQSESIPIYDNEYIAYCSANSVIIINSISGSTEQIITVPNGQVISITSIGYTLYVLAYLGSTLYLYNYDITNISTGNLITTITNSITTTLITACIRHCNGLIYLIYSIGASPNYTRMMAYDLTLSNLYFNGSFVYNNEINNSFETRGNYLYMLNFNTSNQNTYLRVFYTYNYYKTSIANSSPTTPVNLPGGSLIFPFVSFQSSFSSLYPTSEYLFICLNVGLQTNTLYVYAINKPTAVFSNITVNGNLSVQNNVAYKFGSATWNVPSDSRLKNIIRSIQPNLALERMSHIPLYKWQWKCDLANKIKDYSIHRGIMAQDMQLHYPEYVHEVASSVLGFDNDDISDVLTIDSSELIYELIASIQALKEEIDSIKSIIINKGL